MPFNTRDKRAPRSPGPLATSPTPDTRTGNGAVGFSYEDKSALFLLAANSMFSQGKFYETAKRADDRFVQLVKSVTKTDPAWMDSFITWLRQSGNMRTSAVVASVESAMVAKGFKLAAPPNGIGLARRLAQAGIGRADEIGEALGYFASRYPKAQLEADQARPGRRDDELLQRVFGDEVRQLGQEGVTPDRMLNLLTRSRRHRGSRTCSATWSPASTVRSPSRRR